MKIYHVNEHRGTTHFIFATGPDQWLGNGYYFWQDYEFAEEWMKYKKNDVYTIELDILFDGTESNVIDTVFNEKDYYQFVRTIEFFAKKYIDKFKKYPSLQEFNNFIQDNQIPLWKDIIAIRFQDIPMNTYKHYLRVKDFYYKKRIQIVLYNLGKVAKFEVNTITNI